MKRNFPVLLFFLTFAASLIVLNPAGAQDKTDAKMQTITGVVDQTGGSFVLSTEDRLRPIAQLRAQGFSEDNFARFVGLKVRITGNLGGNGDARVLTVRSLNDIVRIGPTTRKQAQHEDAASTEHNPVDDGGCCRLGCG